MVCQFEPYSSVSGRKQYYGIFYELSSSKENDLKCRQTSCVRVKLGSTILQCPCKQNSTLPRDTETAVGYGMAFQASKIKADLKKLTPAPDRPRIFMSNKTSKVVVVFPNGEVVEGRHFSLILRCRDIG